MNESLVIISDGRNIEVTTKKKNTICYHLKEKKNRLCYKLESDKQVVSFLLSLYTLYFLHIIKDFHQVFKIFYLTFCCTHLTKLFTNDYTVHQQLLT